MHKLIFTLLLFAGLAANASEVPTFKEVEDTSYQFYINNRWKDLIDFSKRSISSGVDYFYLRERYGIAAYELGKFRVAEIQLRRAERFNSGDETNEQYLYYAYLMAGDYNDAIRITKKFSKDLRAETGTSKLAPFNYFQVEGGVKVASSSNVIGPLYYGTISFCHPLVRGYTLFHAFTAIQQSYFFGSNLQYQYYISAGIPLGKGFSLSPSLSLVYFQYKPSGKRPPITIARGEPRPDSLSNQELDFLGSIDLAKNFAYARLDLINSFSNLSGRYQLQNQFGVTIYPLANNRLYLNASLILFTDSFYKSVSPLFQAGAGFRYPQFFSFNVVYTKGGVYNFNLYNGYLVENCDDIVLDNLSITPEFTIKRRYSIYATYQFDFKYETFAGIYYHSNGVSVGLKIKI